MSRRDGLGQEVGAGAAQVFQAALLVGTEGPEPLRGGVHPDGNAFQCKAVELDRKESWESDLLGLAGGVPAR